MAKAITVFPRLKTERDELLTKLSEAPVEHAAALLDLYELAQVLHERSTWILCADWPGPLAT